MDYDQARQIMEKGVSDATAFLVIGVDQPVGSPLHEEMRKAALEALSWAHDDDVIDALLDMNT